jgi:hypothetical protein
MGEPRLLSAGRDSDPHQASSLATPCCWLLASSSRPILLPPRRNTLFCYGQPGFISAKRCTHRTACRRFVAPHDLEEKVRQLVLYSAATAEGFHTCSTGRRVSAGQRAASLGKSCWWAEFMTSNPHRNRPMSSRSGSSSTTGGAFPRFLSRRHCMALIRGLYSLLPSTWQPPGIGRSQSGPEQL